MKRFGHGTECNAQGLWAEVIIVAFNSKKRYAYDDLLKLVGRLKRVAIDAHVISEESYFLEWHGIKEDSYQKNTISENIGPGAEFIARAGADGKGERKNTSGGSAESISELRFARALMRSSGNGGLCLRPGAGALKSTNGAKNFELAAKAIAEQDTDTKTRLDQMAQGTRSNRTDLWSKETEPPTGNKHNVKGNRIV